MQQTMRPPTTPNGIWYDRTDCGEVRIPIRAVKLQLGNTTFDYAKDSKYISILLINKERKKTENQNERKSHKFYSSRKTKKVLLQSEIDYI